MKKALTYTFTFIIISLSFIYFVSNLIESREEEYLQNEEQLINVTYKTVVDAFKVHSNIIYFNQINTKEITKLLKDVNTLNKEQQNKIRQTLYKKLESMYKNMKSFQIRQLHFHLKNNDSFLRFHRPELYGDNLSQVRQTVKYVNENKKLITGFEEGRIFNAYRFVYPLSYQNHYIGSVETSVSMQTIINEFKKELTQNVDFIIKKSVVNEKVFKNEQKNYKACITTNEYFHDRSISGGGDQLIEKLIASHIKDNSIKEKIKQGKVFSFFSTNYENNYIVTFYPIQNAISQNTVGYIIVANLFNKFQEYKNKYILFTFIVVMLLLFLTFFIYKLDSNTQNLIHQDKILNEVQKIGHLGYWELNIKQNRLILSDEIYEIFEIAHKKTKAGYEDFLTYVHPEDAKEVNKICTEAIKNKTNYNIEHKVVTKSGKVKYVINSCEHRFDAKGNVLQTFGTIRDITEFKTYQVEIENVKEQFESLVSHIPDVVYRCIYDDKFTMIYLNNSIEKLCGYKSEDLIFNRSVSFESLIHKDDIKVINESIKQAIKKQEKHKIIEYRIDTKDQKTIWIKDSFNLIYEKNNNIYIEGLLSNINAQKEAYFKLQKFIDTQNSIVVLSDGKNIEFANKMFFRFFGYENIEIFKKHHNCIANLFIKDDAFFHLGKINKNENWIEIIESLENSKKIVQIKDKHNNKFVFSITTNQFEDNIYIINFTDISETILEKIDLENKSIHDKLTGAYNREYFDINYKRQINNIKNTSNTFALAILDIDYFKKVNDTYGHDAGDDVLVELVALIKKFSRNNDILIRWGGEEFLLILKVSSYQSLKKALEHLRLIIENHSFKHIDQLTCSMGGTLYQKYENIEACIKRAD